MNRNKYRTMKCENELSLLIVNVELSLDSLYVFKETLMDPILINVEQCLVKTEIVYISNNSK